MSEPKTSPRMLLKMTGIGKDFGRTTVLKDVQLELRCGEVHILAGENGAPMPVGDDVCEQNL